MITGEAATLQLLQPDQAHAVRVHLRDPVLGSPAQVHAVKAEVAVDWNIVVGVVLGVPCEAAAQRPSQLLPHVTHAAGKAHFGHLGWNSSEL